MNEANRGGRDRPLHDLISDEVLISLTAHDRARLVRRLHQLNAAETEIEHRILVARRWFPRFLAACCLILVPWTIGLALSLPRHYVSNHWRAQWTGFDVMLMVGLGITGWGLWRRRQIVIPAGIVTGTLLLCDAWFDVLSALGRKAKLISIASALFAEIPLAALLLFLGIRLLRETVRVAHGLPLEAPVPPLRRTRLLTLADLSPDRP